MDNKVFDIKECSGMKRRLFTITILLAALMLIFALSMYESGEPLDGVLIFAGISMPLILFMWVILYAILIAPKQTITFKDEQIIVKVKKQTLVITSYSKESINLINIGPYVSDNINIAIKIIPYGLQTDVIDSTIIKYLVKYCNSYNIPLVMDEPIKNHVYGIVNAENLNGLNDEIIFEKEKPNMIIRIGKIVLILIAFITILFILIQKENRDNSETPKATVPNTIEIPTITTPSKHKSNPEKDMPEIYIPNIDLPNTKMND